MTNENETIFNLSDWGDYNSQSQNIDVDYLDTIFVTDAELQAKLTSSELSVNSIKFLNNPSTIQYLDTSIQSTAFTNLHKQNLESISLDYTTNNIGILDKNNIFTKPLSCNDSLSILTPNNGSLLLLKTQGNGIISNPVMNEKIVIQTTSSDSTNKQFQFLSDGTLTIPSSIKFGNINVYQTEAFTQSIKNAINLNTSKLANIFIDNEILFKSLLPISIANTTGVFSLARESDSAVIASGDKLIIQTTANNINKQFQFLTDGVMVIPNGLKFGNSNNIQTEAFISTDKEKIQTSAIKLQYQTISQGGDKIVLSAPLEASSINVFNNVSFLSPNKGISFYDGSILTTANTSSQIDVTTDSNNKKTYTFIEGSNISMTSCTMNAFRLNIAETIRYQDDSIQNIAYSSLKDQINTYKTMHSFSLINVLQGSTIGTGDYYAISVVDKFSDETLNIQRNCLYMIDVSVQISGILKFVSCVLLPKIYLFKKGDNSIPSPGDSRYFHTSSSWSMQNSVLTLGSIQSYLTWQRCFYFRGAADISDEIKLHISINYNITAASSPSNLVFNVQAKLIQL